MKCDMGTINDSGYTLNPDSGVTAEYVSELLTKGKKNWTREEKKTFKKATFGSNRYTIIGSILFLVCSYLVGMIVGTIVASIVVPIIPIFTTGDLVPVNGLPITVNAMGNTAIALITAAFVFLGIVFFARVFLNTDFKHLICGRKKFDWKLFWLIFAVYFVLLGAANFVCRWNDISVNQIDFAIFLPMLIFSIVFVFMQTTYEELYFRCFLSRAFYRNNLPKWPKALILILVSGVIFMIPHLANPEVTSTDGDALRTVIAALVYFVPGASLMAVGLICETFVPSVAIHFANNLFVSTILAPAISALNLATIFTDNTAQNNELTTLLAIIFANGVSILVVWAYKKHMDKKCIK